MKIVPGTIIKTAPYKGAEVVSVATNGWCKCRWPDGRTFSARDFWLIQTKEDWLKHQPKA